MAQIILASHGALADGMKSAADMILGENDNLSSFCLSQYPNPQDIKSAIQVFMDEKQNETFIMISDIKGGSIHNQLVTLCDRENVFLVSGMNLNLVLELVMIPADENISNFIKQTIKIATQNITYFDAEIIKQEMSHEEEELW